MDTFTVRDLRERTGELIRDAEEGKLSLVTKRGQPVFLAVPFSEELIEWGIHVALAINLYKTEMISLRKAALIAGLSLEAFIEKLKSSGISIVQYPPEELENELAVLDKLRNKKE